MKRGVGERTQSQGGATLVEVLVVVSVLGVLAGVVVFAVSGAGRAAEIAACATERRELATALEASRQQNDRLEYPPVAGADGLDAVRAEGLIEDSPAYWRYGGQSGPAVAGPQGLRRTAVDQVSLADCN